MAADKFSDVALRSIKPRNKQFKLSDGGGLFLLVNPSGSRLWRFAYRFGGRHKALALGSYPATSLADAREARRKAKGLLEAGTDPGEDKKERKVAVKAAKEAAENTFAAVAEKYLTKRKRKGGQPSQRARRAGCSTIWRQDWRTSWCTRLHRRTFWQCFGL
jgi:hypothetical protein